MPKRPWKLELGDFAADAKETKRPAKGGAGKGKGRGVRRGEAKPAIWKPSPDAKTVHSASGHRLSSYLARQVGGISVRRARELIEQGRCRVNGRVETFASYQIARGDVVECDVPQEREHTYDPRRVLYRDDDILAYDKPAWLPVTRPDGPKGWSLTDILKHNQVAELVIPVHRLDADTSGIVLFALREQAARRLEEAFRDHLVAKTYLALVRGHPREQGEHRSYLIKVASGKGFERWKSGRGAGGREAITTWEVEERIGSYASLVRVEPKSGRYHQIRIHFSEMGHPLYGDRLYGDRLDPVQMPRHMLHAAQVRLRHPTSREPLTIRAPLPEDFRDAMTRMR